MCVFKVLKGGYVIEGLRMMGSEERGVRSVRGRLFRDLWLW